MPAFELLKDKWGNPLQALAPDPTGVAVVAIGAVSARVALPADSTVLRVASNQKCYFRFGDAAVAAAGTDSLFQAGTEIFTVPAGATHIAVIQDGAVTGTMTLTRMV